MSDDADKVECGIHGSTSATFICHHLGDGESLGFNVGHDPEQPDDLYPDAWCDLCNDILEEEGEWNDKAVAFADIKLVCSGCYREIRDRNWLQDEEILNHLISSSFDYLKSVQDVFMEQYKAGDHDRWDWYQETGKLIFSNEGMPVVECDIDFVGTLSTATDTWMWAWANESFTENIKKKARAIRDIGEHNGFLKLACAHWSADEVDGWEMTSIMAKEIGAIGAYRTTSDNGYVYMVINNARWVKPKKSVNNILGFFRRSF